MDNFGAAFARLHHPLKADRVVLGHRRSHNQNGIGVAQILLCRRGAAAAERCAQTGHSGAMSYPRLIADANHAQPGGEQLFDEVIFFVVESRSAQVSNRGRLHQ